MRQSASLNRRSVLKGAAALGVGAMAGRSAFAQDRVFVPYSNKSLDFYFFVIQEEAVKRAVEANSWEFQATNANFDNTRQLEQWQSLMLSQPSAIVSDPIDSQAIVSAIRRYNQQNIPVAIIDTPADGGDVAITVSFDNYIGGEMAAQEIINRLVEKYGSPRGTVLNCFGALQSVAWRQRKEGMDAEFAKYPDINYLARPTEGQLEQMLAVTLSTLSEYPDLDAVHAPSDSPSRGIVTALQQRDRWKPVGEDGHVTGVKCARVDEKRRPIPGSEFILRAELVLVAIGFAGPLEAARALRDLVDAHLAQGGRLHQAPRHMLGRFHGRPGARGWRRQLSEGASRARDRAEALAVYDAALAEVMAPA